MKLSDIWHSPLFVLIATQVVIAYEWFGGGIEKIRGGVFLGGIAKTLSVFEKANPHTWYVDTVLDRAKQSPEMFAQLVQWGELFVGMGLVVGALAFVFGKTSVLKRAGVILSSISLIGGIFMNVNFYYAAGWMSPSTSGLNLVMTWVQIILLIAWMGHLCQKTKM